MVVSRFDGLMSYQTPPTGSIMVLSSGGMDSTACIALFARQGIPLVGLFVDYGQSAAEAERLAARAVANHYNVSLHQTRWSGGMPKGSGLIRGRNAFLLLAGLMEMGGRSGTIAIGLHSGTPYYDCSSAFISGMQDLFDGYTDGAVRISAPFLGWTKRQIWEFCQHEEVPIALTHSCEEGSVPCGHCLSCRDREALHA